MKTDRLNAFTDGVVAIINTIMVLALPIFEKPLAVAAMWLVPDQRFERLVG